MTRKHLGLLVFLFTLLFIFSLSNDDSSLTYTEQLQQSKEFSSTASREKKHRHQHSKSSSAKNQQEHKIKEPKTPLDSDSELSLELMTRLLADFSKPERSSAELIETLAESGQAPQHAIQSNPYTGAMKVIRTENPPKGTRYFHAQYFGEAEGFKNDRLQHLSFEFRPGTEAFENVVAKLRSRFDGLREPSFINENFVSWEVGDNYVLWVKRMDQSDLKDHPFNAYSAADIGSIRVAIEEEIHDEDHHHH